MLVSYSQKFLFIHIFKIAGTSITKALSPYGESMLDVHKHVTARELQRRMDAETFSRLFKFAFVRNPWEWQVALYTAMLEKPTHRQHSLIKSMRGFDEYIQWRVDEDKRLQRDFLTDDDGILIVDFIGKYENLKHDFKGVCKRLGVQTRLPHIHKSSFKDYRKFYSDRSVNLVYEHFKEDIEFLGYSFD